MTMLDTATKIWTFIMAGAALVGFIALATWNIAGVFARFEYLELENALLSERIEYVDDRAERLVSNHEEEHHEK